MTPTLSSPPLSLHCHPATPAGLKLDVSATMQGTLDGVRLVYTVSGNTARLRIPTAAKPGPADGLWQHTCMEAFVAADTEAAYTEFNFSPSGHWATYRFASERQRETSLVPDAPAPVMQLAITPTLLTLEVHLHRAALPLTTQHIELALCAVIEELDGRLSYWALEHPQTRPDFHNPAGRSLRLALPTN